MSNYFNSLPLRTQLQELGKCRFMDPAEFEAGVEPLAGKKLVIIGCGAQGFNQGLNLRDSGLNVAYALRKEAIEEKLNEWANTPSPEMAGEQEPTAHGDAYDFAQSVNLSLKRYLDAEDMKVGLKEHKVEDIREAYEAKKNK